MKIEIYGNCPQCKALSEMLKNESVEHEHITEMKSVTEKANELNLAYAPIVVVDGEVMKYRQTWIQYFRDFQQLFRERE